MAPLNKQYRIFLAEDHHADVLLIQTALNALEIRFDLQIFSDGERAKTALEQARHGQIPDLILLDINLPRINGFDLLQSIKAAREFNHVPVALLTSSRNPKDRQRAAGLNADAFVIKPVGLENFLRDVGQVLGTLLRLTANNDTSLRAFCLRRPAR
jgi:CheY-like chemotaxis protein